MLSNAADEYEAYRHEVAHPVDYTEFEPCGTYGSPCGRYIATVVDEVIVLTPAGARATVIRGFVTIPGFEPRSFIERLHAGETARHRVTAVAEALEEHLQIDNVTFRLECVAARLQPIVLDAA